MNAQISVAFNISVEEVNARYNAKTKEKHYFPKVHQVDIRTRLKICCSHKKSMCHARVPWGARSASQRKRETTFLQVCSQKTNSELFDCTGRGVVTQNGAIVCGEMNDCYTCMQKNIVF